MKSLLTSFQTFGAVIGRNIGHYLQIFRGCVQRTFSLGRILGASWRFAVQGSSEIKVGKIKMHLDVIDFSLWKSFFSRQGRKRCGLESTLLPNSALAGLWGSWSSWSCRSRAPSLLLSVEKVQAWREEIMLKRLFEWVSLSFASEWNLSIMIVVIKWVCYRSSISSAGCTASSFFQCFSHSLVQAPAQRYSASEVKPWAIFSCLNPHSRSGGDRGEVQDEVANNVVPLRRWERDPCARQVARGGRRVRDEDPQADVAQQPPQPPLVPPHGQEGAPTREAGAPSARDVQQQQQQQGHPWDVPQQRLPQWGGPEPRGGGTRGGRGQPAHARATPLVGGQLGSEGASSLLSGTSRLPWGTSICVPAGLFRGPFWALLTPP